jgi:hypothetical protein
MNNEFLRIFEEARKASALSGRPVYLVRWQGQILRSIRRPRVPGCEVLLAVAPWTRLEDLPERVLSLAS